MSRQRLSTAQRIVVKVGSALLRDDPGTFRSIASDMCALADHGVQPVLVSSGAVAMGRPRLGLESGALNLEQKQAAAAAGQPVLVQAWESAFAAHGRKTAQALITLDVTESRRRWLNARATLDTLLGYGAIPVVNENDTVATDEIRYGDNDRLAARVAQLVGADILILLSDIDGLYDRDPRTSPDAHRLTEIDQIDASIHAMAGGANTESAVGSGGMRTKILAAEIAAESGCATLIADGRHERPVLRLEEAAHGTWFAPARSSRKARENWIAGSLGEGAVRIDTGAARALRDGNSLLAVGVRSIEGEFERGETVRILDADGSLLGRGICAYDAADARRIQGCRSEQIEEILGYSRAAALIHVDDMVLKTPSSREVAD